MHEIIIQLDTTSGKYICSLSYFSVFVSPKRAQRALIFSNLSKFYTLVCGGVDDSDKK